MKRANAVMTRECHADVVQMRRALHMRVIRIANAMKNALDARITRVAPDVRSALHSMGYFWSVLCVSWTGSNTQTYTQRRVQDLG
jgi:hypothetical protein